LRSQLTQAKNETETAKKNGQTQAEEARKKGYAEGYAKGVGDGETNAAEIHEAKLDVFKKEVAETFESVAQKQLQLFKELEDSAVTLAVELAQKLFLEEAAQNPHVIQSVIANAFLYLGQEEKLRVLVNPLDAETAEKSGDFWKPIGGSVQSIEVVADAKIERGGCLIESEKGGSVDMRVQTMLGALEAAVKKAYGEFRATSVEGRM
jgi:flagellar assembly protein FliH